MWFLSLVSRELYSAYNRQPDGRTDRGKLLEKQDNRKRISCSIIHFINFHGIYLIHSFYIENLLTGAIDVIKRYSTGNVRPTSGSKDQDFNRGLLLMPLFGVSKLFYI